MYEQKVLYLADGVEYYPEDDTLLLIRCPECGCDNYAPNVANGTCFVCGYDAHELIPEKYKND